MHCRRTHSALGRAVGVAVSLVVGDGLADSGAHCVKSGAKTTCEGKATLDEKRTELLAEAPANAVETVVGNTHACSRLRKGAVMCWGSNDSGQLGDGTNDEREQPVLVRNLGNVVELALGSGQSCARRANGDVFCWGMENGKSIPTRVPGVKRAREITSGHSHACARVEDGTVWCWGYNRYGQLGDGTQESRNGAVQVAGVIDAEELVAGGYFTCARSTEHTWCWGNGMGGEDGTEKRLLTPGIVKLPASATSLVAGESAFLATFAARSSMVCRYALREEPDESTAQLVCTQSRREFRPTSFSVTHR
jgi:alpha-tubulin suppressor-like RCC1 family protein